MGSEMCIRDRAIASTSTATATHEPVLESVRVAKDRYKVKKRSQKFTSREHCPTLQPPPQQMSEFPEQSVSGPAAASTSTGRTGERSDEDRREVIQRKTVKEPKDRAEKRKRSVPDAGDTVRRAQQTRPEGERLHSVIVPRDRPTQSDTRDTGSRRRRSRSRSTDRSTSRRRIDSAYRQPMSRSRSREHFEQRQGMYRSSRDWRPNTEHRGLAPTDIDIQSFARQMFNMMQNWRSPREDRRSTSSERRKQQVPKWPNYRR